MASQSGLRQKAPVTALSPFITVFRPNVSDLLPVAELIPQWIENRTDLLAVLKAHREGISVANLKTRGLVTPEAAIVELRRAGHEVEVTKENGQRKVRLITEARIANRQRKAQQTKLFDLPGNPYDPYR